jgi:hypothetical protein
MEPLTFNNIDDYRNEVVKVISITSPDFYNHFKVVALDYSKDVILFLDANTKSGVFNSCAVASLETLVAVCSLFTDGLPTQEQVDAIESDKTKTVVNKLLKRIEEHNSTETHMYWHNSDNTDL